MSEKVNKKRIEKVLDIMRKNPAIAERVLENAEKEAEATQRIRDLMESGARVRITHALADMMENQKVEEEKEAMMKAITSPDLALAVQDELIKRQLNRSSSEQDSDLHSNW